MGARRKGGKRSRSLPPEKPPKILAIGVGGGGTFSLSFRLARVLFHHVRGLFWACPPIKFSAGAHSDYIPDFQREVYC